MKRTTIVAAAALVVGGITAATASAQEAEPQCITGLSFVIDAGETGSAAGPPIAYSAAISVVGIGLPSADSPLAPIVQPGYQAFVEGAFQVTDAASAGGVAFFQQLRDATQPLAAGTEQGDQLALQGADQIDELADTLAPAIQPGDRSLHQLADAIRAADCTP